MAAFGPNTSLSIQHRSPQNVYIGKHYDGREQGADERPQRRVREVHVDVLVNHVQPD